MKRIGQVTYELSEEEYNRARRAVEDIDYFMNHGRTSEYYEKEAYQGISILTEIFTD